MRKKLFYLLFSVFAVIFAASFAACGITEDEQPITTDTTTETTTETTAETETFSFYFSAENSDFGSVSCKDASGSAVSDGAKFEEGITLTLNATANTGYVFDGWYNGTEQVSATAEYTFTMPASELTLVAKFEKDTYAFNYSSEDANKGSVSCDKASGAKVAFNDSVEITAIPETGYNFVGFYKNGEDTAVSTDAVYSFTMPAGELTLVAKFVAQKREVNFYVDADIIKTIEVDYDTAAPVNTVDAKKDNHVFIDWFTDPLFKNVYGGAPIQQNTNLFAKFDSVEISYTVRFFDYDGRQIDGTQEVKEGNKAIIPADPERAGYDFFKWSFGDELFDDEITVISDMDIYAKYNEKEYTVRFYLEKSDAEDYAPARQTVKHGKTADKPQTPTKANYVFLKWLLNGEYEFDFEEPITEDMNFYAVWKEVEKNTYTVVFYDGQGGNIIDTQIVEEGGDAAAPSVPEMVGKVFKEWSRDFTNVNENINEIYAIYETATCEVVFAYYNSQEGKDVEEKFDVLYNSAAIAPTCTEKTGYIFVGWDKGFDCVVENMRITAVYEIESFTATFYIGTETYGVENADYGNTFKIPQTPDVAGYSFMGWFTDEEFKTPFDFTDSATENVNVYGKLDLIVITTYTVKFVDGTRTISEQTVVEHESATRPGDPSKTGYTFTGWDNEFDDVICDMTINAEFTINKYTVSYTYYEEDGITLTTVERQVDYLGNATDLVEVPLITGKHFYKWDKNLTSITKDIEVSAVYAKNTVLIRFMDEDGTTEIYSQLVEYGGHASIPDTPTKPKCTFKTWVVEKGSDTAFSFKTTVITEEICVYAEWENVSGIYSVYFKDYDGESYGKVQRIIAGYYVVEPATPPITDADKEFDGWYIEDTEEKFDFDTPIVKTITLVARVKDKVAE